MGRTGQEHGAAVTLLGDIVLWCLHHIIDLTLLYAVFALSVYLASASTQLQGIARQLARIADSLENPEKR